MACAMALANRNIVSLVLRHLSDMKYKERRQRGPDQPVEFLEFRPTLVPSILVNKLWAAEGTAVLWKQHPNLPALGHMRLERRQWYANKVECLFILEPTLDDVGDFAYLEGLDWPKLKKLELELDWRRYGSSLKRMFHSKLEHLELLGVQQADSKYITDILLPDVFHQCTALHDLYISPTAFDLEDPIDPQALVDLIDSHPSIKSVRISNVSTLQKDLVFRQLSQRAGLETLEIDLDPGMQLSSLLSEPPLALFQSLRRLHVMCYPEIALLLPAQMPLIEELEVDLARIPDDSRLEADHTIIDDIIKSVSGCSHLNLLRLNVGPLTADFPSSTALPNLKGESLMSLATSCPRLQDLTIIASEPASINGSAISSLEFEAFCKHAPCLKYLNLKLDPKTAVSLETSALQSLSKHCPRLEVLLMKVALQVPSLSEELRMDTNTTTELPHLLTEPFPPRPSFPNLTHLSIARPSTILFPSALNIAQSPIDPNHEAALVSSFANALLTHFPRLEILSSWGSADDDSNECLNYFLPRGEPLASTWEFLSGVEQDLWEDGGADADGDVVYGDDCWDADFEEGISFESWSSGDWEIASKIEELTIVEGVLGMVGGENYMRGEGKPVEENLASMLDTLVVDEAAEGIAHTNFG